MESDGKLNSQELGLTSRRSGAEIHKPLLQSSGINGTQFSVLVSLSLNAKENQIGPVLVKSAFLVQPAMTKAKLVIFICQNAQTIEITGSVDLLKLVYFSQTYTDILRAEGRKITANCIS